VGYWSMSPRIRVRSGSFFANYDPALIMNLMIEVLDGILDYPNYYALTSAFSSPSGSLSALITSVNASQKSYSTPSVVGSFLENHDQPRFQSLTQDISVSYKETPFIEVQHADLRHPESARKKRHDMALYRGWNSYTLSRTRAGAHGRCGPC